jgi:Protein of unknown function (DUF4038)/Putative collagen-binding domain of a collagenase
MIRISDNHRFLVRDDGTPFFYLGDTAWALFQRLDREESARYLRDRAAKGFTVIQATVLSEFDGLRVPNPYGELPLHDADPLRPNDDYFRHVDDVVDHAASLGLVVGLLPTWGDKVGPLKWGIGPEVFTPENAGPYGAFLGARYRDRPIIWILGGDRIPETERHKAVWRAMAEGLRRGDGGRHLITYHPLGVDSSSAYFHDEPWLDFNMLQSCHLAWDRDNYNLIARDYARAPTKPCLDGEPNYEDMPMNMRPENGYFAAYDARKSAYWALFAGAHGHTYGANGVFQFWDARQPDRFHPRRPWHEALALPGASQMVHARRLLESRPFLRRVPDQSLLVSDPGTGTDHVQATRADDGSYAFVYSASGQPFAIDLGKLSGQTIAASWFDPRTGTAHPAGRFPRGSSRAFVPPAEGRDNDWVLVLDDEARGFPAPGSV